MTVSMRVLSAGDGYRYLLRTVAAADGNRSLSTPLTRYYMEAGTPPGRWLGDGVTSLGAGELVVGDVVSEAQLQLLMGMGRDPITGEPGSHPVGTGVGASGGAMTGAAVGTAVAGPVGTVVGAAIGAVAMQQQRYFAKVQVTTPPRGSSVAQERACITPVDAKLSIHWCSSRVKHKPTDGWHTYSFT